MYPGVEVVVLAPAPDDLGRQRRRRPRVHHIGVTDETTGAATVGFVVAGRGLAGRIDRQGLFGGQNRLVITGFARVVERIPDRERNAEEPLTADEPVRREAVDPVLIAVAH